MPSTNISRDRCQFEGCTDEIGMIRSDTVESRRVFCRRHRATMRHRETDAKRRNSKAPAKQAKVKRTSEPPPALKSTAKSKKAPKPRAAPRPAGARDIPESFEHALRCMALVDQLGGIDRAQRIAEALA